MTNRDWFGVLKTVLETETKGATMTSNDVETMIADIVSGRIEGIDRPKPRRLRRRWFTLGVTITVFAGGATVAAALWNKSRPERSFEGISCHGSTEGSDDGIVIRPPTTDPIAVCAELWRTGVLPNVVQGGPRQAAAPTLFACVGSGGGLEVFPALTETRSACSDLGLLDAITDATDDPLVALQVRLTNDINIHCIDLETAERLARAIVLDLELVGWEVTVRDDPGSCVKAGQDPATRSIYLFTLPDQQTP